MAIEFNCPSCSAVIRVPDSAAGGKGKCPRCTRRIKVPKVSTRTEPKPPPEELEFLMSAPEPAGTESSADPDEVLFAEAPEGGFDAEAPFDPFAPAPVAPGTIRTQPARQPLPPGSVASKLRKKQGSGWGIPVFFGLLLCGAVGWYVWQNNQQFVLSGEVTATTAPHIELPVGEVDRNLCRQSPTEVQAALDALQKSPVRVPSSLMVIQIGANKRGLTFQITAGTQTQFYRVEMQESTALASYRKERTLELEQVRGDVIERSVTEFIDAYQAVRKKEASSSSLSDFRNSLALPALVRGLGHQVVAQYGSTAYPCVYEDRDGALYFLLPPGAKNFDIVGRNQDGKTLFPGRFQVKVTGAMKEAAPAKPTKADQDAKGMSETDPETEMKADEDSMKPGEMKPGEESMKPEK